MIDQHPRMTPRWSMILGRMQAHTQETKLTQAQAVQIVKRRSSFLDRLHANDVRNVWTCSTSRSCHWSNKPLAIRCSSSIQCEWILS